MICRAARPSTTSSTPSRSRPSRRSEPGLRRQLRVVVAEVVGGRRRGDRVGDGRLGLSDHAAALDAVLASAPPLDGLVAVAHRVVHGGERFSAPVLINDAVVAAIRDLSVLAPLHNPVNADGIEVARRAFPEVPHVAVFDTAFHATIPQRALHVCRAARLGRAPVRVPRHLARLRRARGRADPCPPARGDRLHRAAPRQRRQRHGGQGRPQRRHLDGADASGRAGDGDAVGRRRPGVGRPRPADAQPDRRRDRFRPELALRPARAGRRQRHARSAPADRDGRRRRRARAGRLLLPDSQVRGRVHGRARRVRRDRVHGGRRGERPGRAGAIARGARAAGRHVGRARQRLGGPGDLGGFV